MILKLINELNEAMFQYKEVYNTTFDENTKKLLENFYSNTFNKLIDLEDELSLIEEDIEIGISKEVLLTKYPKADIDDLNKLGLLPL